MTLMDYELRLDTSRVANRPLEGELSNLAAEEAWIEQTASQIVATHQIDLESALAGTRLAAMWLCEYETIKKSHPSTIWSQDFQAPIECRGLDPKAAIEESFVATLARASHLTRDAFGEPRSIVILAGRLAFCEGFDGPTETVWTLMMTEEA